MVLSISLESYPSNPSVVLYIFFNLDLKLGGNDICKDQKFFVTHDQDPECIPLSTTVPKIPTKNTRSRLRIKCPLQ